MAITRLRSDRAAGDESRDSQVPGLATRVAAQASNPNTRIAFSRTNLGQTWEDGQRAPHVFTPENVRASVEQSLRRMRTDHLDLVQFHASPSQAVLEEGALDALRDLQREGKVRFLGMSGTLPHLPDHIAIGAFDAFQTL